MPEPRRILHCDMDCFYAAVHMRDDPSLRGRPVVIGGSPEGRGVVAAASYEARAYGIRSATPAARAVRLCPQAVFIKPEFPRYRSESRLVFAIFREFTELVQPVSIDEAYLDVSDHLDRWGSATEVAKEIRRRVREERGLTVSIGVASNRLVAKIASDRDKPDGLTVVPPSRVQEFLDPLPVRSLSDAAWPTLSAPFQKPWPGRTAVSFCSILFIVAPGRASPFVLPVSHPLRWTWAMRKSPSKYWSIVRAPS